MMHLQKFLKTKHFFLEGSGFAVTEESIKISEIDIGSYLLKINVEVQLTF